MGVRPASVFQTITSMLKIVGLSAIIVLGVMLVDGTNDLLSTTAPLTGDAAQQSDLSKLIAALYLVFMTYNGWTYVGYVAGEMKDPLRALPRGIMVGLAIVAVVYLATNTVYYRTLGIEGLRETERVDSTMMTSSLGPIEERSSPSLLSSPA